MNELEQIGALYYELIGAQDFVQEELDYALLEEHRRSLSHLARIGNSGISVFDLYRKEHVYYSPNFAAVLGYDVAMIHAHGNEFLDAKIHPEDFVVLLKNGITLLKLFYAFSREEKNSYKLINEYRILNADGVYVRLIEQHQALALDRADRLWLTLSIIDISPNQASEEGVKSQLINFKTGKMVPFEEPPVIQAELTRREREILSLVKNGLLSKEISDRLSISINTVNTHRQRILEKLGANNAAEAVSLASKLGLLA